MTDAEHAVQEAAANIPADVCARFETAAELNAEDRKTIIDIARQALARFQPKPDATPAATAEPSTPGPSRRLTRRSLQAHSGTRGEVMSDTMASLRRQINSAGDLQSVVRTMKALAASSIGQYETSVRALADYYRTVELGLSACLREQRAGAP